MAVNDTLGTDETNEDFRHRGERLENDTDGDGDARAVTTTGTCHHDRAGRSIAAEIVRSRRPPNCYGSGRFNYSVSDGNGGTDTATVATVTAGQRPARWRDDAVTEARGQPSTRHRTCSPTTPTPDGGTRSP